MATVLRSPSHAASGVPPQTWSGAYSPSQWPAAPANSYASRAYQAEAVMTSPFYPQALPPPHPPYGHNSAWPAGPALQEPLRPLGASRNMSGVERSSDFAYHPYRPQEAPSPTPSATCAPVPSRRPILFVDTTQQASASNDALRQCRRQRKRITPEQLARLTEVFEMTDSPSYDVRDSLGAAIGMSNREVQVWCQNRRAKVARQAQAALAREKAAQGAPAPRELPGPSSTLASGQHQWRVHTSSSVRLSPTMPPPPPRPAPPPQLPRLPPHPEQGQPSYPPPQHDSPSSMSLSYSSAPCPTATHPRPVFSPPFKPGPAATSYFPRVSPPLVSPSLSVASSSSTTSSYFSRDHTPSTTATPTSSPSHDAFRHALDSSRPPFLYLPSLTSRAEGNFVQLDVKPELIHLAPIRDLRFRSSPPQGWGAHRRAISDSAAQMAGLSSLAEPALAPDAQPALVRISSLHAILNDISLPPSTHVSAPSSPVRSPSSLPASPRLAPYTAPHPSRPFPALTANSVRRPRLTSRSTTNVYGEPAIPRGRRSPPQDITATMASPGGRDERSDEVVPPEVEERSGLGLLVAAATELSEEDGGAQRRQRANVQLR
ncbi:hypothetical protein JCM10213_008099 [Rhodosporidiobolus nylandii]